MTTNVPGSGIERGYTIARRGRCVRFSTTELATHLGGSLSGPDVTVDGAGIDSRTIAPGQLFVPVVAERDGHAFIPAALERRRRRLSHRGGTRRRHRRRGGGHRDRTDEPRRAGPQPGLDRRGGDHRLGREDDDQGPLAPLPRLDLPHRGQRALLQQRARSPPDAAQRTGRRAVGRPRNGRPERGPHCAVGARGATRRGDRHQRGHGPRRVLRRTRRGGSGQGRTGPGAAREAAWPS